MPESLAQNLYVHFPFCRRKCTYCALYSRCGVSEANRAAYVAQLVDVWRQVPRAPLRTIYFGGGSPALCDLRPILDALDKRADDCEFTVELHPLDATDATLRTLRAGGVNRISIGVQSLDDATLADMGRGYTADEARRAFARVRRYFDNAGIDLIVGYPPPGASSCESVRALADWGLTHCSVYSLQLEERSILARRNPVLPSDDETLDCLREVADALASFGLARYEISNYARRGCECRHNLAVWRGEDYLGLGDGAFGRLGLCRTRNGVAEETLSPQSDWLERKIFRLRTREGLDISDAPAWRDSLDEFVREGLLTKSGTLYRLTPRGTEVCDTLLAALVSA